MPRLRHAAMLPSFAFADVAIDDALRRQRAMPYMFFHMLRMP